MDNPYALTRAGDETALSYDRSQDEYRQLSMEEAAIEWLKTKAARTNSAKTERAYKSALVHFMMHLEQHRCALNSDPRVVARLAQEWSALPQKQETVSTGTRNQRLAIISSYYTFAMKHGACADNPIKYVERPPRVVEHAAPHLDKSYVNLKMSLIDTSTREGKRDKALLSIALTTGRRASELASLRWGDIDHQGNKYVVTWKRCKGAKVMHDDLSPKTIAVLLDYLKSIYGPSLERITAESPVFISFSNNHSGGQLSTQAISNIYRDRLDVTQVHVTRHTFAVNMERAGASLSEIGERLGHNNLKTTSDYMKQRHSSENKYADALEEMFGI